MLVCDLVVPPSGCGTLGSLPTSQRGLKDQHGTFLASCLTSICCWLNDVPGFFGEQCGRGIPKGVPRGAAFLLGFWGLYSSLQSPWAFACPRFTLSCWNVGLEISSLAHRLGASAWWLDRLGRVVWGDQAGLEGSQRKRRCGVNAPQEAS